MRPKVSSVAVEVTAHCQQKCDYCYNEWREDNGAKLRARQPASHEAGGHTASQKLLARVAKLLTALDLDHVTITGGEPFARRDIFELFDLVRSRGVGIQIISNGGIIDDAIAARLSTYRVSYVQITLNGPTAAIHEERVGEGHFEPTLRGIRALVARGVPVIGCVVVTRRNAQHVGATLALFRSLGVSDIALSRFSPAGYATRFAAELLPSRDDLLVAFRQALPFARGDDGPAQRPMRVTCTMPVPPCAVEVEELAPLRFGSCAIGTSMQEFALGPDGRLRNCTLHRDDLGGARDVLDDDVDPAALVLGPAVRDYKKTLPSFCEGCAHASTCGGGCGAAAEWVLGARTLPDPFVWQHVDDDFARSLREQRSAVRRRLEVIQ